MEQSWARTTIGLIISGGEKRKESDVYRIVCVCVARKKKKKKGRNPLRCHNSRGHEQQQQQQNPRGR